MHNKDYLHHTHTSISLYLDQLHQTFPECGSGTLALFSTIQIVVALASSLIGGILQNVLDESIGLSWLFFFGGAMMAFGFVVTSISTTVSGVLLGSICLGIGIGPGLISSAVCVLWFEKSRGTMLLLAISGQGLGNVFFPWLIVKLLDIYSYADEVDPWRPTMRWMGLLTFFACTISANPMRLPVQGEAEENRKKIDVASFEITSLESGQNYGSIEEDFDDEDLDQGFEKVYVLRNKMSILKSSSNGLVDRGLRRSAIAGAYQSVSTAPYFNTSDISTIDTEFSRSDIDLTSFLADEGEGTCSFGLKDVAYSSTYLWLSAFTFISCFASLNAQVLIPKYCLSLGYTEAVGGLAMTLFGLGMLLSNVSVGVAVDRVGARHLLTAEFVAITMVYFVWPLCVTQPQIYLAAFLFGCLLGPSSSLPLIILADAFATSCPEHILALNGMLNMCKFPGYLFGSAFASHIVQELGGYKYAAVLSAFLEILAASMLFKIPSPEMQQLKLNVYS